MRLVLATLNVQHINVKWMDGVEFINGLVEDLNDIIILNTQTDTTIRYRIRFLLKKPKKTFLREKVVHGTN